MGTESFRFGPNFTNLFKDIIGGHTDVILVEEKGIIPPGKEHHIEKVQLNLNEKLMLRTEL